MGEGPAMVVGTSGYDYDAWTGTFYPEELKKKERLAFYAARLGAVEINASFYRKPSVATLEKWGAQAPESFRFALKGWQRVSHMKRLRDCEELVQAFTTSARALGQKLGPTLWQLPPNFKKDAPRLKDFLALLPKDQRFAFEFRNESWFDDETYSLLQGAGAALCIADSEERATPPVRTAPHGYLRLRRAEYDEAALRGWAERIRGLGFTAEVAVFFKHEDEARGPAFATAFARLAGG